MKRTFASAPLLLLLLCIGTSSAGTIRLADHGPVRPKHRPDLVADVGDLYDACKANQSGAALKFEHKLIEVTGEIRDISLAPPRLDLQERDRWFGGVMTCDFSTDSNRALANMSAGQTVTAVGMFKSCADGTTLTGCVLRRDQNDRARGD